MHIILENKTILVNSLHFVLKTNLNGADADFIIQKLMNKYVITKTKINIIALRRLSSIFMVKVYLF